MAFCRYLFITTALSLFSCKQHLIEVQDDNGNVIESYQVNDKEQKHGQFSGFDENGKLIETANYVNGKLEGERQLFKSTGELEIAETYKNDITEGLYRVYFSNGQVSFETEYTNGTLNGIGKSYYETGVLKEEVTFVNNEENGPFREYYSNGNMEWEGTYLNGDNEFGLLKNYDESGELVKKMQCDSLAICRTIWTKADGDITPIN